MAVSQEGTHSYKMNIVIRNVFLCYLFNFSYKSDTAVLLVHHSHITQRLLTKKRLAEFF